MVVQLIVFQIVSDEIRLQPDYVQHESADNLAKLAWNRWFDSPMGPFYVNSNGDLENTYGVSGLPANASQFKVINITEKYIQMWRKRGASRLNYVIAGVGRSPVA